MIFCTFWGKMFLISEREGVLLAFLYSAHILLRPNAQDRRQRSKSGNDSENLHT